MPRNPTSAPRRRSGRASQKRALDAFAIASTEDDQHRLAKKARRSTDNEGGDYGAGHGGDDGEEGLDIDRGSDSEGNEWRLGGPSGRGDHGGDDDNDDDDSDIDSDEAMGESDEERFADYVFRGSSSVTAGKKKAKAGGSMRGEEEWILNEDDDGGGEDEEGEECGEGYIDLSEMLDRATPQESEEEEEEEEEDRGGDENEGVDEDEEEAVEVGRDGRGESRSGGELGGFGHGLSEGEEDDEDDDDDDDDGSFHGLSDEEVDVEEDPLKLEALESLISGLPSSSVNRPAKRARINDPNEGKAPGEYNLALTSDSKKLTVHDLLPSVAEPALKKSLKLLADDGSTKSDKKGGVPGKLAPPLAKRMQDRIDRAAAYGETKETLKRWVDTVKLNREADHLRFPLANAPNAPVAASKRLLPLATGSAPLNEFEAQISGILKESQIASEKQIQEFEQLATQKLSVEDLQRRTAELRMARELMYREELKAKRIKKIKSKSYHRLKKKERLRQEEAIRGALTEERDGKPDSDEEMEHERKRATERMSLKHKQSRWAKGVRDSGRAAWDDDARHGAVEMAQRSEDLRRRIQGKHTASDGEESGEEESEDDRFDEEGEGKRAKILQELEKLEETTGSSHDKSNLMAMKFMQNAEALKRKENEVMIQSLKDAWADDGRRNNDADSEEEREEDPWTGRMAFKPGKQDHQPRPPVQGTQERLEFEAPPGSDEGEMGNDESSGDDEVEFINKASSKISQPNPFSAPAGSRKPQTHKASTRHITTEETVNPWLRQDGTKSFVKPKAKALVAGKQEAKGVKASRKLSKDRSTALDAAQEAADGDARVTIDTSLTLKIAHREDPDDDEAEKEGEDQVQLIPATGKKSESQRELVKMAFAGDDVVREFRKDKKQTADEDDDQVIDQTLPGWGSWAGTGLSRQQKAVNRRQRRVLKTVKGVSKDKRQDAKLRNVIINEKRDKKVSSFCHAPHRFWLY